MSDDLNNDAFYTLVPEQGMILLGDDIVNLRKVNAIRKQDGISGFPNPEESVYDAFGTEHSSTAASIGLGMARAHALLGVDDRVVCVVGDGALTGGMALEALNDIGQAQTNMTVILNDNHMSISRNVGAISRHLARLRAHARYVNAKIKVRDALLHWPVLGKGIKRTLEGIKRLLRRLLVPDRFFESLGFHYLGPFDGHDLHTLPQILKNSKNLNRPVLVHVVTKKGKGYAEAERQPSKFHGIVPYLVEDTAKVSMSAAYGEILREMAREDERIVAITAAMAEGTGLMPFSRDFPQRFFDVGIAEQHAATMAAGMARGGLRPFLSLYSTFLQRAYDQISHDISLSGEKVTLMIDRAGFVGEDGRTHQGLYDIALLRNLPHMSIFAPSCVSELRAMMRLASQMEGPVAIRYAKDGLPGDSAQ